MTRRQKLRAASCLGKATYRTKPAALRAVADYKRRVPLIVDDVLDVYRCRFGAHWHFGHNRRRTMPVVMCKEYAKDFHRMLAGVPL
ncbi:MAG: hypothetical protein OXC95_08755 [Dehalococcoidia bacterium]|nr:hypothetical protein [Dehalococcoidia bacterium]